MVFVLRNFPGRRFEVGCFARSLIDCAKMAR
jgi:hypothetical protein